MSDCCIFECCKEATSEDGLFCEEHLYLKRKPPSASPDERLNVKRIQAINACISLYESIQRSTVNDMPMEVITAWNIGKEATVILSE